jgi:site-specific DNA-methyltransferase (adenine-specific)
VLDPFAGSGTTLLAAAACGRSAVGVELDPRYAALAWRRLPCRASWS